MVQKVLGSNTGLRQLAAVKLCNISESREDKERKERDRFRLSSAVPRIQWASNPYCLYGHQAIENLYLFFTYTKVGSVESHTPNRPAN